MKHLWTPWNSLTQKSSHILEPVKFPAILEKGVCKQNKLYWYVIRWVEKHQRVKHSQIHPQLESCDWFACSTWMRLLPEDITLYVPLLAMVPLSFTTQAMITRSWAGRLPVQICLNIHPCYHSHETPDRKSSTNVQGKTSCVKGAVVLNTVASKRPAPPTKHRWKC